MDTNRIDARQGAWPRWVSLAAGVWVMPPVRCVNTILAVTMVSMIAIGAGLLLSGGVMAARFGRRLQHA